MKKKILIIENDDMIREMLKQAFEAEDFDVFIAEDGAIGLSMIEKEKPDAILLDIMMDNVNGIEVMKSLNEKSKGILKKVVIMTNASENSFVAAALEYGVTSFIVKGDHDIEKVISIVKKISGTI